MLALFVLNFSLIAGSVLLIMNIDALKGGKKEQVPSGGNTPGNGD